MKGDVGGPRLRRGDGRSGRHRLGRERRGLATGGGVYTCRVLLEVVAVAAVG